MEGKKRKKRKQIEDQGRVIHQGHISDVRKEKYLDDGVGVSDLGGSPWGSLDRHEPGALEHGALVAREGVGVRHHPLGHGLEVALAESARLLDARDAAHGEPLGALSEEELRGELRVPVALARLGAARLVVVVLAGAVLGARGPLALHLEGRKALLAVHKEARGPEPVELLFARLLLLFKLRGHKVARVEGERHGKRAGLDGPRQSLRRETRS